MRQFSESRVSPVLPVRRGRPALGSAVATALDTSSLVAGAALDAALSAWWRPNSTTALAAAIPAHAALAAALVAAAAAARRGRVLGPRRDGRVRQHGQWAVRAGHGGAHARGLRARRAVPSLDDGQLVQYDLWAVPDCDELQRHPQPRRQHCRCVHMGKHHRRHRVDAGMLHKCKPPHRRRPDQPHVLERARGPRRALGNHMPRRLPRVVPALGATLGTVSSATAALARVRDWPRRGVCTWGTRFGWLRTQQSLGRCRRLRGLDQHSTKCLLFARSQLQQ